MEDEKKPGKDLYTDYRNKAAANAWDLSKVPEELSTAEIRELLHELHVHQIELNLQNAELLRYQTNLELERDRVIDLYDFAPVGYLTVREDGIILEANLTAATMLQLERGSLLRKSLGRYIADTDGDRFFRFFREHFKDPDIHTLDIQMTTHKGGFFEARLEAVNNNRVENGLKTSRIAFSNIDPFKAAEKELALYRANLEELVDQRTAELAEANRQLTAEIAERMRVEVKLRELLEEKEVLLREVHHRVRNNMQAIMALLAMKSGKGSQKTDQFLLELEEQVRTMLLVYNQLFLSQDLAHIDMVAYIDQLTTNINHAFGNGRDITFVQKISPVLLNIGEATPCGLIINELVTNALKYAFPHDFKRQPKIEISLTEIENRVQLTISDNGVGLPEGLDWRTSTSMGLHMVGMWATYQLGGRLEISQAEGTCYSVVFEHQKT